MQPSDWLKIIYANVPSDAGPVSSVVWCKQTKHSQHFPLTDPGTPQAMDAYVADLVSKNHDAYYTVCLMRPHLTKAQKGAAADVRVIPGFWLDIDINYPGVNAHAAKNLPTSIDQALEILTVLPEPTVAIDSGHGLHVYWLLDIAQPCSAIETAGLGNVSKAFQAMAIGHASNLGYHVDSTHNLDRVLRLPGSVNTKNGLNRSVTVLDSSGPRYASINALAAASNVSARAQGLSAIGGSTAFPAPVSKPRASLSGSCANAGDDSPRPNEAQKQNDDMIRARLESIKKPDTKELIDKVLAGEEFAPPGKRDHELQRVCSIIAYVAPDRDPEELSRIFLDASLKHHDDVDLGKFSQEDRIQWAAEKIARAQSDARKDRLANDRMMGGLMAQARSSARRAQSLGPAPTGPYTEAEIEQYAAQQQTSKEMFLKQLIIQKADSFYVYVNGDYQKPIAGKEFMNSIKRDFSPAEQGGFVSLETFKADGDTRKKKMDEILYEYSQVARTVIAHLDQENSWYDATSQTFHEAVCPIRPLEPDFCQEIDDWLILLGGPKADRLLDWVATVTRLDRQSPALYLNGPPGTGKSLLSHGLAKLWRADGSPTELGNVLGNWTEDITRCPLILADESITTDGKKDKATADLRRLIGSPSRTLSRKYISNSELRGAIRLVLCANNKDMLTFNEILSKQDTQAIAERFLYIEGDDAASQYLSQFTLEQKQAWITDDKIAKHALWLRDNHKHTPGKRFIIDGSAHEITQMMVTRGHNPSRVTEWIVKYLSDTKGKTGPTQAKLVVVGNGKCLINTQAVSDFWSQYISAGHLPSTKEIGAALKGLAWTDKLTRKGTKNYHDINVETVCSWADEFGIGSREIIEEKVAKPLKKDETEEDASTPAQQV